MMPFKSKRELTEEVHLTDAERRLHRALGDNLYDWIQDFEQDEDVVTQD